MTPLQAIADLNDLALDLPRFEQAPNQFAAKLQLDLSQFSADHISVRCHQDATAERWRQVLMQCASLLLPYPGGKRYLHEGWEHLELALRADPDTLHARALSYLADEALLAPGITLKQSVLQGEGDRLPNPSLAISDGSMTIKFHPYSIREIVTS
ncbi:VOC family protein [Serratia symbiotica]|uniref:VOC family protein n=1 Tax=Serratia symbiotica TaxID=138074 RepID=UPI001DC70C4E|nr:VOC family protein [Serratia symbiotica]NIG87591.1 VOC family protein [Serratia symbiotica]USS96395.1 VOC family protein [Serratia symbiotica]